MKANNSVKDAKKQRHSKAGYLLIFALLLAIGICLVVWQNTLPSLAATIGCILAIFGIVFFVLTIAKKERGFNFAFHTFFSLICIIGGVVTVIANDTTIGVIISLSSLFLIVDASFKLNTTAMSKRYSVPLWWVILVLSIAVILSSYFLLEFNFEDLIKTSKLLGVTFIVDAFANLLSAIFISAYERRQQKEAYIEFYKTKDNPPKWTKKLLEKEGFFEKETAKTSDVQE